MTVMPSSLLMRRRVHDDGGVAQVERGDRLVRQQDLRLLHERAGDRHALLLTAGELIGPVQPCETMSRRCSALMASVRSCSENIMSSVGSVRW